MINTHSKSLSLLEFPPVLLSVLILLCLKDNLILLGGRREVGWPRPGAGRSSMLPGSRSVPIKKDQRHIERKESVRAVGHPLHVSSVLSFTTS